MKSNEALEAEQRMESRIAEAGLDQIRRVGPTSEAAPEGTPAETVQADEQPRDEAGRFASLEQPEELEAVPAEEAVEASPQEEVGDPAVAAFLAKYNGNIDEALKGAAHLQRKAGQQSNEVGELRRMVDELSELRSSIQQQQSQQPQPVLDQATVDWFDEQAAVNPYGAAEYARQQNNPLLLQRALSTWKEIDPYQAAVYTNNLQNQEVFQQFEERLAKAQQLPQDATMHMALTNVMSRNPELSSYSDMIADTLQKYPAAAEAVRMAAEAGDTGKLEAGIETLYALAQGDTLKQIVRTGSTPAETTTTSEVVAPTVSEVHGQETATPSATEQMKAAMNEEIANRRRGVFVAE